ncbi:putative tetratricopeptide-like helical domain superfamily [Helianthus annuus]|nr:putative tetratricopeptide-like helical domain superfamily [Helianthus annuus]KAJ0705980.1 putative tetratricopeptide-like helical domain superfamily [Helianthus annuus]KAJ0886361.1 putative tetratricopeptide-like helical domain superfamily [Helianthus annuus]KAJ0891442.1 putative tetratricopeptide-like helical domain superfamily [Helianthus annuus]
MLLSSTPSRSSWFQQQNPKPLPDFIHRNLKSPTLSLHSAKNITRASSEDDLVTLSRSSRRNSLNNATCLISSFVAVEVTVVVDGVGVGGGGGRICGGDVGGNEGCDNGGDGMDGFYRSMIEANPSSSLVLGNYAKYLKEVKGDVLRAEEYCSRAILANPSDATALSMYADLIWKTQKVASRVQSYFDQAVKASPDDSYVMAAYAHFLWDADEEVSDTNLAASSFVHEAS